jgi:hypothetical protein
MISNFSTQDILLNSNPDQRILWNEIYLQFGDTISIRPHFYSGPIGGSEFLSFLSNKIYLAYKLDVSYYGAALNSPGYIEFRDSADVVQFRYQNLNMSWNLTTSLMQFLPNSLLLENLIFGRILATSYTYIKFVGFRIGR